jgi:hypothetical protein
MICTPCGQPVEPNTAVIAGIEREGKLEFRWACEHHPVGDAAVILASSFCAAVWVADHPEYGKAIDDLLAAHEC